MKKIFLTLLLSAISMSLFGQAGISVGVKAGLNIPQISAFGDNPMSKGYSSRLAGNAGIFAEFGLTDHFSIVTTVEYTQQGGKRSGMQAIPAAMLPESFDQLRSSLGQEYLYADFKSETKFNYLMIPVHAKFGWRLGPVSPFKISVSAGPFVSFLLSSKQVTKGSSYMYIDPAGDMTLDYLVNTLVSSEMVIGERDMNAERKITDDMNKVNFGVSAAINISYDIAPRHTIFIEGGGNYGFIKLQKNTANGENRIGAGTVALGYSFRVK